MKKWILIVALMLSAIAEWTLGASAQESAQPMGQQASMLRLRSGDILWGQVVEHDAEELRFRRLDTGGVVHLPWSFLDPSEESSLRLAFGYVELASEELLVDAERFRLRDGSELLGIVDGRDDQFIWLKNVDGRVPVPVGNIDGAPARVRAPALEIYTRQELYLTKQDELGQALLADGSAGAEAHDALAQYCERLFDYIHALEHYTYVQRLDASYEPTRIAAALSRAKLKAHQQEQLDVLSAIDLHSARGRFDRALAALALFEERYPESPLREDWIKLRDRVKKAQLRAVREEVRRSVYSWTIRLARDAVRSHTSYASLVAYLDDGMQKDLFKNVGADLAQLAPGIEAGEIKRIWLERKFSGGKPATYGVGTWLLGRERVSRTYKKESAKDKAKKAASKPSKADARKQLDQRIEKYIRNQQLSRKSQARGSQEEENEEDNFWKLWNYTSRWHWAQAYFAENSELFKISSTTFTRCRECGGAGVLELLNLGGVGKNNKGGTATKPCPTCHTFGVVRRIRYR